MSLENEPGGDITAELERVVYLLGTKEPQVRV
jgi:hypothetical protein